MSKAERAAAEAEHLAKLMVAAPPEGAERFAPPTFLDTRFASALAIWREYVPRLAKMNLFEDLDRYTFALFCVYYGEWVLANEDVQKNGYSRYVKTVSGDRMPRENPAVARRDTATKYILEFSKRFGLTQLDRYALMANQAGSAWGGGLFPADTPKPAVDQAADKAAPADAIGSLSRLDSPPPGSRPN